MRKIVRIIDIIYSFFLNLKLFSLKVALKMPLLISHNTRFRAKKGAIVLENKDKRFNVRIGYNGANFINKNSI